MCIRWYCDRPSIGYTDWESGLENEHETQDRLLTRHDCFRTALCNDCAYYAYFGHVNLNLNLFPCRNYVSDSTPVVFLAIVLFILPIRPIQARDGNNALLSVFLYYMHTSNFERKDDGFFYHIII